MLFHLIRLEISSTNQYIFSAQRIFTPVFLSKQIPAVTLGLTTGKNIHTENATMKIAPIFKGIAQVIGVLMAIDSGMCDEL